MTDSTTLSTDPAQWSAQDWVDHYSRVEKAVTEGKTVKYDGGQGSVEVTLEDLATIRKARKEWEHRVGSKKNKSKMLCGGVKFCSPGLS